MYADIHPFNRWAATWQNQQNECVPSEDSDQPGHPPSLIRVFAVRMRKAWVLSYPLRAQQWLWSDWADAQSDLSLRWAQSLCWFCQVAAQIWNTSGVVTIQLFCPADKWTGKISKPIINYECFIFGWLKLMDGTH